MAVKKVEELRPVYLIYGEEELLLDHALRRLRDRIAQVADLDFNSDSFEGETADASAVVAAANTLPFASDRRLVVVRNVDKMNADGQAVLAKYVEDPAPTACLVLVARKLRRDSKLFKAVNAAGGAFEYQQPKRGEYPARVVEIFASKSRKIDLGAASALVQAVGRDLRRLDTEADKIVAYAGERTVITAEDVSSVVVEVAPVSVFEFTDALGHRRCAHALEVLDDLLASGEDVIGVHGRTVWHLRNLIATRAVLDRGGSRTDVMREVGMADWQAKNVMEQAKRFSARELSTALRSAAELDARLKSGRGEPRVIFEMWVASLCREQ